MWNIQDLKGKKVERVEIEAAADWPGDKTPTYGHEVCIWFRDGTAFRLTPAQDPRVSSKPVIEVHGKVTEYKEKVFKPMTLEEYQKLREPIDKALGEKEIAWVGAIPVEVAPVALDDRVVWVCPDCWNGAILLLARLGESAPCHVCGKESTELNAIRESWLGPQPKPKPFHVRCDETTNSQKDVEEGKVQAIVSIHKDVVPYGVLPHDTKERCADCGEPAECQFTDKTKPGSAEKVPLCLSCVAERHVKDKPETCKWSHDLDTDSWDTECGNKHCFIDGGPDENGQRFCPYCGGRTYREE